MKIAASDIVLLDVLLIYTQTAVKYTFSKLCVLSVENCFNDTNTFSKITFLNYSFITFTVTVL